MPQDPTRQPRVTSAAKTAAYALLNAASPITERRLAAVVDGAACLIDHSGDLESARLLLQSVTTAAVANAVLVALITPSPQEEDTP